MQNIHHVRNLIAADDTMARNLNDAKFGQSALTYAINELVAAGLTLPELNEVLSACKFTVLDRDTILARLYAEHIALLKSERLLPILQSFANAKFATEPVPRGKGEDQEFEAHISYSDFTNWRNAVIHRTHVPESYEENLNG
jgi:hypothetical protein